MKKQLRTTIRKLRNSLTPEEQQQAGEDLLKTLKGIPGIFSFKSYGIYLPSDGEIHTDPIIQELWIRGARVYLPVVLPDQELEFRLYRKDTQLIPNRYGILEPAPHSPSINPRELNLLFMPLVAFDPQGNRLGMGGGYYDRLLNKLRQEGRGPIPLGLAHNCQLVNELPAEAWDIPVPAVATPRQIFNFQR